jgi:hypothetical protein
VGRWGVYTSIVANGFALLGGHLGGSRNQGVPGVLATKVVCGARATQVPPCRTSSHAFVLSPAWLLPSHCPSIALPCHALPCHVLPRYFASDHALPCPIQWVSAPPHSPGRMHPVSDRPSHRHPGLVCQSHPPPPRSTTGHECPRKGICVVSAVLTGKASTVHVVLYVSVSREVLFGVVL